MMILHTSHIALCVNNQLINSIRILMQEEKEKKKKTSISERKIILL